MKDLTDENIEQTREIQQESGTERSLSHVLLLLLGARSFFLIVGIAFFFSKVTEVLLLDKDGVVGAIIEALVISFIFPAIVWVSTRWGERVVKEASLTHKQLLAANQTAQREIAERKNAESALLESEERSQRLAKEYALLAEIGRIISSSLDTNEVYEAFAERVQGLLSFDSISISTIDYRNSSLTIAYLAGLTTPGRELGTSAPLEGTLSEYVANKRSGVIIDVNDVDTVARELPGLIPTFNAGFKSVLAAPLMSKDKPIGALQFRSKTPDIYSHRHITLAESVAAQVAGAVANSQLHETLQREAEEREALAKIGQIIGSSLNTSEVYERFAEEMRSLVEYNIISINLVDLDNGLMHATYHSGETVPTRLKGDTIPLTGTLAEEVIRQRSAILLQGTGPEELSHRFPGLSPIIERGLISFISTPLTSEGRIIGFLSIGSNRLHPYTDRDKAFVERVGSQIAGAVANSQLHAAIEREVVEKSALAEIGKTLSLSLDIDEVYDRFASLVKDIIPFERLTVSLADYEHDALIITYHNGDYIQGRQRGDSIPISGTLGGKVLDTRSPIIVHPSSVEDLRSQFPQLVSTFNVGFRSFMGVPLISEGEIIGVLQFRSRTPNVYDESMINTAESVASHIVGTIVNSRLHATVQREAQERTVLAEIGRIISSTLSVDDVYERFAYEVHKLIPFDRIGINTIDTVSDTFTSIYVAGLEVPLRNPGQTAPLQGSVTAQVVKRRRTVRLQPDDPEDLMAEFSGLAPELRAGIRSFLSVPLISRDNVIGVLHMRSTTHHAYTKAHQALGERIAAQIAGAIANSQLHTQRLAAEEALRLSEWRYRHMVESASDIVYTTDANGYFNYVNPPASRLTEYAEEELIGCHFTELIAEGWKHRVQRFYTSQLHRRLGETLREFPIVTKSGNIVWVEQSVVPLESNGVITGFEGIGRDITKRRQVEAERERLITELRAAIAKINTLSGLLPICASCKKIRDDKGYWSQIETYIRDHSEAEFSHGICPDCVETLYPGLKSSSRSRGR